MGIPPALLNMWEHSRTMRALNERRSKGEAETMTCTEQLVDILRPLVQPGWTLLDAACGTGHYWLALRELGLEYYGLDFTESYIRMGQANLEKRGLPPSHLELKCLEHALGRYDVVTCFNALLYLPNYHQALERLAECADRYLIIRTLLGDATTYRYVRDGALDDGFNHCKLYFNIYGIDEVKAFLEDLGFSVELPKDRRTNDEPAWVNNMWHPWRMLVATRRHDARIELGKPGHAS